MWRFLIVLECCTKERCECFKILRFKFSAFQIVHRRRRQVVGDSERRLWVSSRRLAGSRLGRRHLVSFRFCRSKCFLAIATDSGDGPEGTALGLGELAESLIHFEPDFS